MTSVILEITPSAYESLHSHKCDFESDAVVRLGSISFEEPSVLIERVSIENRKRLDGDRLLPEQGAAANP